MLDCLDLDHPSRQISEDTAIRWATTVHAAIAAELQATPARERERKCRHELRKALKKSVDSTELRTMLSYSPAKDHPFAGIIDTARKALLNLVQIRFGLTPENKPITDVLTEFSPKGGKLDAPRGRSSMTMGPRPHT